MLTVELPGPLYTQLRDRAHRAHRSIEDELLNVLATAVPVADELPADLAEAISPLAILADDDLWRAARTRLSADDSEKLDDLHAKRLEEGLTESESETLSRLVRQYERTMLVRAQAAAILYQRGHDVSCLKNGT
jgi:plasmid stability protein